MDNTKKTIGAYVWYRRKIKRITGINIKNDFILDRELSIKRASVKLVKVGDAVNYIDLSILPGYCAEQSHIVITKFSDNDCIATNVDRGEYDDTDYRHFKKA